MNPSGMNLTQRLCQAVHVVRTCFRAYDQVLWCGDRNFEVSLSNNKTVPNEISRTELMLPPVGLSDRANGLLLADLATPRSRLGSVIYPLQVCLSSFELKFVIVYSNRGELSALNEPPWGTYGCFIDEPGRFIYFE